jgi:LysM repeat protein
MMKTNLAPTLKIGFYLQTVLMLILLSACQAAGAVVATARATPTAILAPTLPTSTPTNTSTSPSPDTATPLPSPTATPRTHVVKKGEDFGGIAYQYGITLKALMAANPKVNPNIMSVGTTLVIPSPSSPSTQPAPNAVLPTAVPVQLTQPNCYPTQDGGLDCFALANNTLNLFVESVTVTFRLGNLDTGEITSLGATTPLNLVPPGWSLPLHAIFPPPLPAHFQAAVELQNALPYTASDQRYINVRLENSQEIIAADGLSAVLQGDLILEGNAADKAGVGWVAATAFDAHSQVVGLRRWEASAPLVGGQPTHFLLRVYSAGAAIDHLTILAEARR